MTMADNEIKAQIDKLRKTRPARFIDATMSLGLTVDRDLLVSGLSFLCDDLKEEARLLEVSKTQGRMTIMKDRNAVAGWLELFVLQLGREGDAPAPTTPSERLSPSPELGEHRPSEFGEDWATNPGPGGRCAVGNVHDESTLKCPCGYDRTKSVTDYLSGASDTLPTDNTDAMAEAHRVTLARMEASGVFSPSVIADAAAYIGDTLIEQIVGTGAGQASNGITSALGLNGAEQAAHDTIDRELNHVTADALPDPFAPIPAPTYGPKVPPGGRQVTALDLLTPMDASLIPAHVSFSQLTTVADCGVKFRLQRVEQLPQVPQWANVGGKAFHAAVEAYEALGAPSPIDPGSVELLWLKLFNLEIEDTENVSGMARSEFRASQQGKENYDWWRVEGALMLQRYVDWRQGDGAGQQVLQGPSGAPMLEWETRYAVDHVPFKTILDSVWTDGHSERPTAIIRDWKTGSLTPDDRQLCTQAWGLRMAGWTGPVLVQFFDARKGAFSEPFDPFERMTWDDVRYFVLSGDAERRLPIPSARPSDFCGGCPVAYACPIMAQRKAPKVAK
jgi:hypothetical protein